MKAGGIFKCIEGGEFEMQIFSSKSHMLEKIIEHFMCFRKGARNIIHCFLACSESGAGLGTCVVQAPKELTGKRGAGSQAVTLCSRC